MQIPENIFYVSTTFTDVPDDHEYRDIQRVIDLAPDWAKYTIVLCSDYLGQRALDLHGRNIQIRVDGQGEYGIIFNDVICNIREDRTLKFTNMKYIRGTELDVTGTGGNIHFDHCKSVVARLRMNGGKYSHLYMDDTKYYGADGFAAINMFDNEGKVDIKDSFVKGGTHSPAIHFDADSDRNVSISRSVLLHCDGGENAPITRRDHTYIGIYAYLCASSVSLCDANIVNYLVTGNGNIIDPEVTY